MAYDPWGASMGMAPGVPYAYPSYNVGPMVRGPYPPGEERAFPFYGYPFFPFYGGFYRPWFRPWGGWWW
ncbi:hypothetical protein ACFO4N_15755 [Camelliibacillus cellulosilyticus]|uniref:Spore coat protein n=1 Tax=Camelliibacillus cellulosilyticus TaxID=2174486 RepID=A0ABV9GQ84_9BACL